MGKEKIGTLQGLRFLFFLMIFSSHVGMFRGVNDTYIYKSFLSCNGAMGVVCFFVLSGFMLGISKRKYENSVLETKNIIKKRLKQFYPMHIFFWMFMLPVTLNGLNAKYCAELVTNLLLIQSWFPQSYIHLGMNSVSWYLSTLLFLCLFNVILVKLANWIDKTFSYKIYYLICICDYMMILILALNWKDNAQFWLYFFPPIRMLDYLMGFCLGRIFVNKKRKLVNSSFLEIICIVILFISGWAANYVPLEMSRVAIFIPGAVLTIYVYAQSEGVIASFFNNSLLIKLGENGLYYMLSHQVIMRYLQKISSVLGITGGKYAVFWIIIAFFLTLMTKPIYDYLINLLYKNL